MQELLEPIQSVLRNYCHVEWYEVSELADDLKAGRHKLDSNLMRSQFVDLINLEAGQAKLVNNITANEFDSDIQAREWLAEIFREIF